MLLKYLSRMKSYNRPKARYRIVSERVVIARSQTVRRSTVNVTVLDWLAPICVNVRTVTIERMVMMNQGT